MTYIKFSEEREGSASNVMHERRITMNTATLNTYSLVSAGTDRVQKKTPRIRSKEIADEARHDAIILYIDTKKEGVSTMHLDVSVNSKKV